MIQKDDVGPGNWIEIKLAGSLRDAHKIIETDITGMENDGVLIEKGEAYTLTQVGHTWQYPKLPIKVFKRLEEINGIPLTIEILDRCGFKLTTEGSAKSYSDKHGFTINYTPGPPIKISHQSSDVNIAFVHQLQNVYSKYMNRELEISIDPYNYQLSRNWQ